MEILSSRTILRPRDQEGALEFYGSTLGLAIAREYPGGTVFFAGQSLIEIAAHGRSDDSDEVFHGALWLQVRDVYDVGTYNGRPFLVMELLEGERLYDRLARERRLSPKEALEITTQPVMVGSVERIWPSMSFSVIT